MIPEVEQQAPRGPFALEARGIARVAAAAAAAREDDSHASVIVALGAGRAECLAALEARVFQCLDEPILVAEAQFVPLERSTLLTVIGSFPQPLGATSPPSRDATSPKYFWTTSKSSPMPS